MMTDNINQAIDRIEDEVHDSIHMKGSKNYVAYTYANDDHLKRYRVIMFFKYNVRPPQMAHEVKHAVNVIFADKGVKLSLSNDEAECYYIERIMEIVCKAQKEYHKKYKRHAKRNPVPGSVPGHGGHGRVLDNVPDGGGGA